jgi:hypothetical protein
MKVTAKIQKAIATYTPGEVFAFNELLLVPAEYLAGLKALSRMVGAGLLKRAGTGKYYKPSLSPFGELKPAEEELLRTYIFANGKRIAYITGHTLYNRLGLSTQVPKTIQVASRDKRITTKVGNLKVKPVKSYVDVTENNYKVLGLLDAIKDFNDIPDRNTETALVRLRQLIKELSNTQLQDFVDISLEYPPRARALAGALLEWSGFGQLTYPIAKSLNPLSIYNFAIPKKLLPTVEKWKID